MPVGEYQTRTRVVSAAGLWSTGSYWEKPVSTAAVSQAGSSRNPSMSASCSRRGTATSVSPAIPAYAACASCIAGAAVSALRRMGSIAFPAWCEERIPGTLSDKYSVRLRAARHPS